MPYMVIIPLIGIAMLSISAVLWVLAAALTMTRWRKQAHSLDWYAGRFAVAGLLPVAILVAVQILERVGLG